MTLKEFIKTSIIDITSAIKECQDEIKNGTILCPDNVNSESRISTIGKTLNVSYIDFDVSVSAETVEEKNSNGCVSLNIVSIAKLDIGSNDDSTGKETNVSRIKFSIPIVYPHHHVEKKKVGF